MKLVSAFASSVFMFVSLSAHALEHEAANLYVCRGEGLTVIASTTSFEGSINLQVIEGQQTSSIRKVSVTDTAAGLQFEGRESNTGSLFIERTLIVPKIFFAQESGIRAAKIEGLLITSTSGGFVAPTSLPVYSSPQSNRYVPVNCEASAVVF
jgi:hypothetical protein